MTAYKLNRRRLLASVIGLAVAPVAARAWFATGSQLHGFNKAQLAAGPVGGDALTANETNALGIDFTYHANRALQMSVNDATTASNAGDFDPYYKLVYTSPSVKLCRQSDGVWRFGNHNLCVQSQTFDNAAWTKTRSSVSANSTAAPDGNTTADTLTEDSTASNTHFITGTNATVVSGSIVQLSVFAKPNGRSWIRLGDNNITNGGAYFDVTNGVTGTGEASNLSKTITSVGNGWYRCIITALATSANSAVLINLASADNTISYTGAGTAGVFLWGAEIKRYPVSELGPVGASPAITTIGPIALRGTPTTGTTTNGANITLSLPGGLVQNDVVIVGYAMNAAGTGGTSSGGWTQIGANVTNTTRIQIFRKVMGASPDASIVLTGTGAAADSSTAVAFAFSGVDTTTPEDVALVSATGTSATPDPGAATPATTGAAAFIYAGTSVIDVTGTASPAGYSTIVQNSSNDNVDTSSYAAWKGSLTAGVSENPGAFTGGTSAAWAAYTVILRPSTTITPGNGMTGYVATTSTALYDLPYEWDASGVAQGILIEEARTNLCLWSNDLTNASWTKSNMTTAFTSTGPDGVANHATRCTATAGNATALQSITSASSFRSTRMFVKRITGSGNIDMTMDNGATWTTVTVTSSWAYQEIINFSSATTNPVVGLRIVTSGDAVDVTFFQHEVSTTANSSFTTSPIETFGATVTRAKDQIEFPVASFPYSTTAGTLVAKYNVSEGDNGSTGALNLLDAGTGNNGAYISFSAGGVLLADYWNGGAQQTAPALQPCGASVQPTKTTFTVAFGFGANDFGASCNGAAVVTDASGTISAASTQLMFGEYYNRVGQLNGYLKQVTYLARRASNAELITRST